MLCRNGDEYCALVMVTGVDSGAKSTASVPGVSTACAPGTACAASYLDACVTGASPSADSTKCDKLRIVVWILHPDATDVNAGTGFSPTTVRTRRALPMKKLLVARYRKWYWLVKLDEISLSC